MEEKARKFAFSPLTFSLTRQNLIKVDGQQEIQDAVKAQDEVQVIERVQLWAKCWSIFFQFYHLGEGKKKSTIQMQHFLQAEILHCCVITAIFTKNPTHS